MTDTSKLSPSFAWLVAQSQATLLGPRESAFHDLPNEFHFAGVMAALSCKQATANRFLDECRELGLLEKLRRRGRVETSVTLSVTGVGFRHADCDAVTTVIYI